LLCRFPLSEFLVDVLIRDGKADSKAPRASDSPMGLRTMNHFAGEGQHQFRCEVNQEVKKMKG
jgi:hypothetical protein